jgi:lysophospholipase L1-like esterase
MTFLKSCLVVTALLVSQFTFASDLQQLPTQTGGRLLVSTSGAGEKSYSYDWPSVYFETAFTGDSLTLKFDDAHHIFHLLINDNTPIIITKPGKKDYTVPTLAHGAHKVRLEKITESQFNTGRFLGFYSDDKPAPLTTRNRRIEFIGDSFTVGYGNTAASQQCTGDEVYEKTNSQLAFGPLVAKHFNADYHINAFSGVGLVRNYNGNSPDKSIIGLYPFTLHNNQYIYASNWQPQVIVIGIGTNDFSTALNASDRWKTRAELQQDYAEKYIHFVQALQTRNPKAHFILMATDQLEGEIATQVNKVVTQLKADGLHKIDSIIFKGLEYKGCHWHPSAQDHELLAKLVIDYLKANKVW